MTPGATLPATLADQAWTVVAARCAERGVEVARLASETERVLNLELHGSTRTWSLEVTGLSLVVSLPIVRLCNHGELLAHVGYDGRVCLDDGQGLSIDPDNRPEVVAFAVLAALDLLERSVEDARTGRREFLEELEGYWLGLPGAHQGHLAFELDGHARLLAAFVDTRAKGDLHLIERGGKPPAGFRVDKAERRRALYVSLSALPALPVAPEGLTPAFLSSVVALFTEEQRALWEQLLGPSKNGPHDLSLIVTVPRPSSGVSAIGITFRALRGKVDPAKPVRPVTFRRHTPSYIRERGGAVPELSNARVAVLGCGAVGCVVADALAASGVGRLTLVDHDELSEDNIFRHLLAPLWIGSSKAVGVACELKLHYPGVTAEHVAKRAEEWLVEADLSGLSAIVVAVGAPSVERRLGRWLRARRLATPVVYSWLEPLDFGGHSLLEWLGKPGCLECIYRDDENMPCQAPRTAFMAAGQSVTRNLTGCGSAFVPYGAIQARRTGLLAAEHLMEALLGQSPSQYRYWVGGGIQAQAQGLQAAPWRDTARQLDSLEASERVLGWPCKHCRAPQ